MIRGLTSAARGMIQQSAKQDIIAHNLANSATPGFRGKRAAVHDFSALLESRAGVRGAAGRASGTRAAAPVANPLTVTGIPELRGSLQRTGTKTDLAVEGRGYFVVEGPGGNRLIRGGSFALNADGELVTPAGERLMGESGPVKISGSDWSVDSRGTVTVDGKVSDRLKIVVRDPEGQTADAPDGDRRVAQGAVESSNVNVIREMAAMITNMRAFEASQKTVQSIDHTLDKLINEAGRV